MPSAPKLLNPLVKIASPKLWLAMGVLPKRNVSVYSVPTEQHQISEETSNEYERGAYQRIDQNHR